MVFDKVLNNIEIYYNINKDIINNYDIRKRNYYSLRNINGIKNSNNNIIKDINMIFEEKILIKSLNIL